jgi:hypothetical protein
MQFTYKALRVRQSASTKKLVLFSAKAPDIDMWAGIPQKTKFGDGGGVESAGFQREQNLERIKNLVSFYKDSENIVQNPLLCALRNIPPGAATFDPDPGQSDEDCETGTLQITLPRFETLSLEDIFAEVRKYLERRVPELAARQPAARTLQDIRSRARETGELPTVEADQEENREVEQETDEDAPLESEDEGPAAAESVIFEESHILDFWEEVAARHCVLKELREGGANFKGDTLLGFSRTAMLSYLKPVVLVDGQHRLAGALRAAGEGLRDASAMGEIEQAVAGGRSPDDISRELLYRGARTLPVSLLMSTSPEEQVFQFVIVNQKATPIGKSLLGTIVSTSLANEELVKVAGRLKKAGIRLEESQAITRLARLPESPFRNLVERGLTGDTKDLLQWGVFGSLVRIFRDLSGGILFGQKNDYADRWRRKYLDTSPIVAGYEKGGFEVPYDYWRSLDGPWQNVFIVFWTKVRDFFADPSESQAFNYWGNPRYSNLFNKVSLTILAADFFQYLVETKTELASAVQIAGLVDDWLEDVNRGYFNKDWQLSGVKKDSTGIRNQWASLWSEYRKSPQSLPDRRLFRQAKYS